MNKYIAHSENEQGNEHVLCEHLTDVSDLMVQFSNKDIFKKVFRVTGLLHDIGKYQLAFQKYLREGGRRGSVPHASWGAALCKIYQQIEAAFSIDGHHKGLPDKGDLVSTLSEFSDFNHLLYTDVKKTFLTEMQLSEKELSYDDIGLRGTDKELFIRMLFSSLTDADWLDTEHHFNEHVTEKRKVPEFNASILIELIDIEIGKKSKEGYINQLRNKVRNYAISLSNQDIGFYSMTLPTGMGKTLASISWALHHAKHNNLKRIIVVLPFISIIDQTAMELKLIFGEKWVLEHHSNFNEEEESNNNIANEALSGDLYSKRLATENWDYPIIVTTTVQFFESLFSNKPSRCRKIHNVSQSVVIFDEVQTLSKELVIPTLSMLLNVMKVMDTSFLFCTATQPAFEKSDTFNGIKNIQPLVKNPKEVFDATRRVNYFPINQYQPILINELANFVLSSNTSALCIFNTKKQALLFFNEIDSHPYFRRFHLSTSMYPAHRKQTIKDIRSCLQKNEKIIVSSTQLIEAGVDFDFPCVYREIAPLESIIQSAGRCNREGKIEKMGKVFIFKIKDSGVPSKQYRALAEFANEMYRGKEDLLFEHDFYKEYYRKAIKLFIDSDKKKIEVDRENFNFKTVADKYRLIESKTTPIFILSKDSAELYESIRYKATLSRSDYRAMQLYSVQVYDNFINENICKMGKEPQGYWKWNGEYHSNYGLSQNPDMSNLII